MSHPMRISYCSAEVQSPSIVLCYFGSNSLGGGAVQITEPFRTAPAVLSCTTDPYLLSAPYRTFRAAHIALTSRRD